MRLTHSRMTSFAAAATSLQSTWHPCARGPESARSISLSLTPLAMTNPFDGRARSFVAGAGTSLALVVLLQSAFGGADSIGARFAEAFLMSEDVVGVDELAGRAGMRGGGSSGEPCAPRGFPGPFNFRETCASRGGSGSRSVAAGRSAGRCLRLGQTLQSPIAWCVHGPD